MSKDNFNIFTGSQNNTNLLKELIKLQKQSINLQRDIIVELRKNNEYNKIITDNNITEEDICLT